MCLFFAVEFSFPSISSKTKINDPKFKEFEKKVKEYIIFEGKEIEKLHEMCERIFKNKNSQIIREYAKFLKTQVNNQN